MHIRPSRKESFNRLHLITSEHEPFPVVPYPFFFTQQIYKLFKVSSVYDP